MSPIQHKIYIGTLVSITIACTLIIAWYGISYYSTGLEERFYHPAHKWLKPSGIYGHGLGIVGTLLILIGVFGYMIRKRKQSLSRLGVLKYWLEFHIFLCTLGPIMILFHTAFKFGGIVSISFWSMVAVVASGVVGRFIYKQIPRTIQGRELSLNEIKDMQSELRLELVNIVGNEQAQYVENLIQKEQQQNIENPSKNISSYFTRILSERRFINQLRLKLKEFRLIPETGNKILNLAKKELAISRRIENLVIMQRLFRYWHVLHLPFAIIMLIIMIIHVIVTLLLGYKWIF